MISLKWFFKSSVYGSSSSTKKAKVIWNYQEISAATWTGGKAVAPTLRRLAPVPTSWVLCGARVVRHTCRNHTSHIVSLPKKVKRFAKSEPLHYHQLASRSVSPLYSKGNLHSSPPAVPPWVAHIEMHVPFLPSGTCIATTIIIVITTTPTIIMIDTCLTLSALIRTAIGILWKIQPSAVLYPTFQATLTFSRPITATFFVTGFNPIIMLSSNWWWLLPN